VKYLRLTGEREVEEIVISSLSRELNEENESILSVTAMEWGAKCVLDLFDKYSASRWGPPQRPRPIRSLLWIGGIHKVAARLLEESGLRLALPATAVI
jgi:hypothetical protein